MPQFATVAKVIDFVADAAMKLIIDTNREHGRELTQAQMMFLFGRTFPPMFQEFITSLESENPALGKRLRSAIATELRPVT